MDVRRGRYCSACEETGSFEQNFFGGELHGDQQGDEPAIIRP
jgi:hypothetical protein